MEPSDRPSDFGTFTFVDLAGYTALTEVHGDDHAADLASDFFARMRVVADRHESEILKTIGDAVLLRCADPTTAVRCALETVDHLADAPNFPAVRVGVHTGSAVNRKGEWFGGAINLAARVSAAAAGGETLLTATTCEAALVGEDIVLEKMPPQRFKNLSEDVTVYRASRPGRRKGRLEIDPVCRMAVAPERSAGSLVYAGRRFHFCSLDCANRFSGEPERFSS